MRRANGALTQVEATVEPGDAPDLFELRPAQPLVPEAHYEISFPGLGFGGSSYGGYTVRGGTDTNPPRLGATGAADYDPTGGYCGRKVSAVFRVQDVDDDIGGGNTGRADRWLVRVEVEDAAHPLYAVADPDGTVAIGRSLDQAPYARCFGSAEFEAATAGHVDARVSVLDRAGNRFEARDLTSLKFTQVAAPTCPGEGDGILADCHVARIGSPRASSAAWLAIGLCVAWSARRTTRRSS